VNKTLIVPITAHIINTKIAQAKESKLDKVQPMTTKHGMIHGRIGQNIVAKHIKAIRRHIVKITAVGKNMISKMSVNTIMHGPKMSPPSTIARIIQTIHSPHETTPAIRPIIVPSKSPTILAIL